MSKRRAMNKVCKFGMLQSISQAEPSITGNWVTASFLWDLPVCREIELYLFPATKIICGSGTLFCTVENAQNSDERFHQNVYDWANSYSFYSR